MTLVSVREYGWGNGVWRAGGLNRGQKPETLIDSLSFAGGSETTGKG